MGGGGWKRVALDNNKERFVRIKGFLYVKKAAFVSGVTVTGILAVGFSLCRSRRAVGHHIGLPQAHDSDNLR